MSTQPPSPSGGLAGRILESLALVPTRLGAREPVVRERARNVLTMLKARIRASLDLPSQSDLRNALDRIEAIDGRLEQLTTHHDQAVTGLEQSRAAERDEVKRLRKKLRKELSALQSDKKSKKKRRKSKTTINVGSPKAMRESRDKDKTEPSP